MVEESAFREAFGFLAKIGVYDVILPFLLVFTIVFAILEKTKILGVEKIGDQTITKKNINAIISFVLAFLVIASTQLVAVINQVMSHVVLLLILGVSFLLLVGTFFGDKEFTFEEFPGWTKALMILMFIGIIVIFLNALDWLQYIFVLFVYWEAEWAAAIIFLIVVIGFIVFITWSPKPNKEKKKETD